ncbi:alpha/beta fold hydrolase [archaeon]|nr:alpha/beta fold hydrolase [archaeon]
MQEKVFFDNGRGQRLCGTLSVPKANCKVAAILCHGARRNKDQEHCLAVGRKLLAAGIPVLRFDFSGHGKSEGKLEDLTIPAGAKDVCAAMLFLETKGFKKFLLFGNSRGGVCVLRAAAAMRGKVVAVGASGPGSSQENYEELFQLVSRFDKPVLIVYGANDERVPAENRKRMAGAMPHARLEVIEGAGHSFLEPGKMDIMVSLISGFLVENATKEMK